MSRTLFVVAALLAALGTAVGTSFADVPVVSDTICVLDQPISTGLGGAADNALATSAGTVRDAARATGVMGTCTDTAPANPPADATAPSDLAQFAASALTSTPNSTGPQANVRGSLAAPAPVGGVATGAGGTSPDDRSPRLPAALATGAGLVGTLAVRRRRR